MGRNKPSLTVGGVSLARRVSDALSGSCDELLAVGTATRLPQVPEARPVQDRRSGRQGPLSGIEAGMFAAHNTRLFVAAADLPFLSRDFVDYALTLLTEERASAVVPRFDGLHPLCAAYDATILPKVSAALDSGARSVSKFLQNLPGVRYVNEEELRRFGEPDAFLMNVNFPEDLERARSCGRGE